MSNPTPETPRYKYPPVVSERLRDAGFAPDTISALLEFDSALFHWQRRVVKGDLPSQLMAEIGSDLELSHFSALTAILRIEAGIGRAAPEAVTIGLLAEELSLDPSRASRTANELIKRGYVQRQAAQDDGRKTILTPTQTARTFLTELLQRKWAKQIRVFQNWSAKDILAFSHLFQRYVKESGQVFADRQ